MEKFEDLIDEIEKKEEIHLSSILTNIATIVTCITILFTDYEVLNIIDEIEDYKFLVFASLLTLNILVVFYFLYTTEAYLKGKTLVLKKLFRNEIYIQVDSIIKMDSFGKHTIVRYSFEDETHFVIILSSNLVINGNEFSVEDVLKAAQKL